VLSQANVRSTVQQLLVEILVIVLRDFVIYNRQDVTTVRKKDRNRHSAHEIAESVWRRGAPLTQSLATLVRHCGAEMRLGP
jgi:hypothetical protein